MDTSIRGAASRRLFMLLFFAFVLLGGSAGPAAAQTGGINGFVVDQLGTRIPNATIRATAGPSANASTTSSGTGSYFLAGLNPGNYTFTASATGFQSQTRTFTVTSGITSRLDFTLQSNAVNGGVLTGTVTRSDTRAGLSGATVQITGGAGTTPVTVETSSAGVYRVENLTTGTYLVEVSRPGFTTQQRRFTVTNGRVTTANFALRIRSGDLSTLQGTVRDPDGRRVANARVRLISTTLGTVTTSTNGSGFYRFTRVVPDDYTLEVSATGFETQRIPFTLTVGQRVVGDVVLQPEGPATLEIQGFVVDELLRPIQGARVQITSGPRVNQFDLTDSNGFYQLQALPAGRYVLRASATGFINDTESVDLSSAVPVLNVDFTLTTSPNQQRGSITGRITNSDGAGLSGVTVQVTAGPSTGQSTTTDAEGDYTVEDLPIGTYALTFTRSGFTTRTITGIDVTNAQTTELNVTLTGTQTGNGVLSGVVRDVATSQALSGVTVRLSQNGTTVATTTTSNQGAYSFTALPAGTYGVRFSRSGHATQTLSATINQNQTTTLNVFLTEEEDTGTVTGLVRDNGGRIIQDATVEIDVDGDTRSVSTDADGRFRITVPEGRYPITASAAGLISSTQQVTVTADETTSIDFTLTQSGTAGSIAGVVRSTSGLVIPATVTIVAGPVVGRTRTTSSQGQFTFTGLPSGSYLLRISSGRYRTRQIQVEVRAGSTSTVLVYLSQ